MSTSNEGYDLNSMREAVADALTKAGHTVAAQLIHGSTWIVTDRGLSIEVPGVGKKLLGFTVNAIAEKIIRQELQRLGGPTEFLVVSRFVMPIV
jgi:hypothetical protein